MKVYFPGYQTKKSFYSMKRNVLLFIKEEFFFYEMKKYFFITNDLIYYLCH